MRASLVKMDAIRMEDRKLVVVSNREPYRQSTDDDGKPRMERTTGGLVTALEPLVRRSSGTWIAWDPGGEGRSLRVPEQPPRFTLKQIGVSDEEKAGYYDGFANGALWPLFHYFIDRCHFDLQQYSQYVRINRRFADVIAQEADDDALIWIHDYHFLLTPAMVRHSRPGARMAFFLHIPFPSIEVLQVLPWHREVLNGLLGADLVGFHTDEYVQNFMAACEQVLGLPVDWKQGTIETATGTVRVRAFPIGIDFDAFEAIASDEEVKAKAARLRTGLNAEHMILSVDRLDYSKGILERLDAIEAYFRTYPDRIGRDTFVQIAVPSRTSVPEYQDLKRQLDEAVGRINGGLARLDWEPVHYIYRGLPRDELVAFYAAADVALVTPLRDGMNLVAKEYCAARPDGVIVLSTLAGACHQFGGNALMVNPFDTEGVVARIRAAIEMPEAERWKRMKDLRRGVREENIYWWLETFLDAVERPTAPKQRPLLPRRIGPRVRERTEPAMWQSP